MTLGMDSVPLGQSYDTCYGQCMWHWDRVIMTLAMDYVPLG
jgi:hypothetical protein